MSGNETLRIASIILIVMLVYAGIYAILEFSIPYFVEGMNFQTLTGETLEALRSAGYLKPYLVIARHLGLYAICLVIAASFILFAGFRHGRKWAWWAMLLVCGIAWLWGIVDFLFIGITLNFYLHLIGVILLALGLLLPFRVFFGSSR
jgi:hypothetical protein